MKAALRAVLNQTNNNQIDTTINVEETENNNE